VVVAEFAREHILQVEAHLLKPLGECLERLDFVSHLFGELALRSILDISQKMLDTNLLGLRCAN
jgi:hypothetical protein